MSRPSPPPSRADARALDAADPLARYRERFVVADPGLVYFDGNSLGRLPKATADRLQSLVARDWGEGLVRSWHDWMALPTRVADRLGEVLLGAAPGQVALGDSTSVQLYKLAVAGLDARPGRTAVVYSADDFPTDRYVLQGLAAARDLTLRPLQVAADVAATPADVALACAPGDVALVVLSLVQYRSGALADLAGITAAAHDAGALVLWDLSHAVGAVPIGLDAAGADLAVGCTYKYVNAGPGAPAFAYRNRTLEGAARQPVWGWFGQADQFAMGPDYRPGPGAAQLLVGTPPVAGLVAVEVGVELLAAAGLDQLRAKSTAQTELALELADAWLAPLGVSSTTPRHPSERGSHVALRHADAWRVCQALVDRGVVPDFRPPDVVRVGIAPLYTRFVDVWDGLDRLRAVLAEGSHLAYPAERGPVT